MADGDTAVEHPAAEIASDVEVEAFAKKFEFPWPIDPVEGTPTPGLYIFRAIREGNLPVLKAFHLNYKLTLKVLSKSKKFTALLYALENGHLDIVEWLVAQGSSVVDERCKRMRTAAHYSVVKDHLESLIWVKEHRGAELIAPDVLDNTKMSVLHLAARNGAARCVEWLLNNYNFPMDATTKFGDGYMHLAALGKSVATFDLFEAKGVSPNVKNKSLDTPMFFAAQSGSIDCAKWLLERMGAKSLHDWNDKRAGPIHQAVKAGHIECVQWFLDQGVDLHILNKTKENLLFYSTYGNQIKMTEWLMEKGLDITQLSKTGESVLFSAAQGGAKETLLWLLARPEFGADVNQPLTTLPLSKEGKSLLGAAMRGQSQELARYLIEERGFSLTEPLPGQSGTPIHEAAAYNSMELLRWMASQGVDFNAPDEQLWTPIIYAAQGDCFEAIKFLIEEAKVPLDTYPNDTILLSAAARCSSFEVGKYLVEQGLAVNAFDSSVDTCPLLSAAQNGNIELFKLFVEKGAPLRATNAAEMNALHLAAIAGSLKMVKCLVEEFDFSPFSMDARMHTVFIAAANCDQLEIVKYLVDDCGVSIFSTDNFGFNGAHAVVEIGNIEMLEFFMERGLPIDEPGGKGQHPIHLAANNGHVHVLKWYMSKGYSLNIPYDDYPNPTRCAAANGQLETLKFLVENGVSLTPPKHNGMELVFSAAMDGHLDVLKWLHTQGISPTPKFNGTTALHVAARGAHLACVEWLMERGLSLFTKDGDGMKALKLLDGNDPSVQRWLVERKLVQSVPPPGRPQFFN